jgi:predicted amidophosphoribosyltransferase
VNFTLYFCLFAACLVICMVCAAAAGNPTRSCPDCGKQTPVDGRRCRRCGYKLGRV